MGAIVAVGGYHLPDASIRPLNARLMEICAEFGFPSTEEFKWSPDRKSWMRKKLVAERRTLFFQHCLYAADQHGVQACVCINDTRHRTTDGKRQGHNLDVVKVFLERQHSLLKSLGNEAMLIADHPSGGRPQEAKFVRDCLQHLESSPYTDLERVALILTEDSKNLRLLQLADLIVGCTCACVSGEQQFSPQLFRDYIRPILRTEAGRMGGVGLKIHADLIYGNLYHWLLGDDTIWRGSIGNPLPADGHPYVNGPMDLSRVRQPEESSAF